MRQSYELYEPQTGARLRVYSKWARDALVAQGMPFLEAYDAVTNRTP